MLFAAGATTRLGKIEDGSTVSDWDPDEQKRQFSLNVSILPLEWKDHKVNIVDTPGYMDFMGEVKCGLRAVETALIIIDAVSGVQVGTEFAWRFADELELPRAIFINRMDRENADFDRTPSSRSRPASGAKCIPVHLPIGSQASFKGVVDVLTQKAYVGEKGEEAAIPADIQGAADQAREKLIEAAAETDDALIAKYLEGEDLTRRGACRPASRPASPPAASSRSSPAPATEGIGVHSLLNAIVSMFPAPADRPVTVDGKELKADPAGPLVGARLQDRRRPLRRPPHLLQGALAARSRATRTPGTPAATWTSASARSTASPARTRSRCRRSSPATSAPSPSSPTRTPATRWPRRSGAEAAADLLPQPVLQRRRLAEDQGRPRQDGLGPPAHRRGRPQPPPRAQPLHRRDDPLRPRRLPRRGEPGAHQAQVRRRPGDAHAARPLPRDRPRRRPRPSTRTRSRPAATASSPRVALEVEPLPRGEGVQVRGQDRRRRRAEAVHRLRREGRHGGQRRKASSPTSRWSTRRSCSSTARSTPSTPPTSPSRSPPRMALKQATEDAQPILLEPIMDMHITVPDANTGDVISDLNGKRARVLGMTPTGSMTTIDAQAPLSEVQHYSADMRSLTQGRGFFTHGVLALRRSAGSHGPEDHRPGAQGPRSRDELSYPFVLSLSKDYRSSSKPGGSSCDLLPPRDLRVHDLPRAADLRPARVHRERLRADVLHVVPVVVALAGVALDLVASRSGARRRRPPAPAASSSAPASGRP